MKIYRIPITIHATAYVKADNITSASERALDILDHEDLHFEGTFTSGLPLDHAALPEVSISPAMTVGKIDYDYAEEISE